MIDLKFDKNGLIPVIVQDYHTREVLILAYMNREAFNQTIKTQRATFYSRSRKKLWVKGETSGNFLDVVKIKLDCDSDALLLEVIPYGPACHTGHTSCFYTTIFENEKALGNVEILNNISKVIKNRAEEPKEESYTNYLLKEGIDKVCKKVGEEATETVIAAKNNNKKEIASEAGDLLYHLLVLLYICEMSLEDVYEILQSRHGKKSEIKTLGEKKRGEI